MTSADKPTLRWGIIGTGLISSWFTSDLALPRPSPRANHIIQAVGSSSIEEGKAFVEQHIPTASPTVYGSYGKCYSDPDVDIVYIGTPHAFHKQNCLDAIAHGKHILCEKSFCLNARETREVLSAAEKKGVFLMEAMWMRFFPLVQKLQKVLHEEKVIGDVERTFCDFAMDQEIDSKGRYSRLRDPALGAGSLLDIGIYSLTWSLIGLESSLGKGKPTLLASQTLSNGIDIATSIVLQYEDGRQGIATSHTSVRAGPDFCRIEGSNGSVTINDFAASIPFAFTVKKSDGTKKIYEFERAGRGFYWEADAAALDIADGKTQNEIMPWCETLRVMELLDEARRQGGAKFPQDDE